VQGRARNSLCGWTVYDLLDDILLADPGGEEVLLEGLYLACLAVPGVKWVHTDAADAI